MDEKIQVGLNYLRRFPEALSLEELVELQEKIDRILKDREYSITYDTAQNGLLQDFLVTPPAANVFRYEHYVKNQTIEEVAQAFCKRLSSKPVKLLWVKVWDKNNNKYELTDIKMLPEPKASYWARLEILHEPEQDVRGRQARDLSEQALTSQLLAWDDS